MQTSRTRENRVTINLAAGATAGDVLAALTETVAPKPETLSWLSSWGRHLDADKAPSTARLALDPTPTAVVLTIAWTDEDENAYEEAYVAEYERREAEEKAKKLLAEVAAEEAAEADLKVVPAPEGSRVLVVDDGETV
jgi:hypothetical protein